MSVTTISFYISAVKTNFKPKQECGLDVLLLRVNTLKWAFTIYSRLNAAHHCSLLATCAGFIAYRQAAA